jgi:hypothetical protein
VLIISKTATMFCEMFPAALLAWKLPADELLSDEHTDE